MNSIELEQLALSPLVKSIVLAVIKTLKGQEMVYEEKEVINADLIPSVSEKIGEPKLMQEGKIIPKPSLKPPLKPPVQPKSQIQIKPPAEGYGKINGLLKDPSVSYIECPGAGKSLSISRTGQKQLTKISLTADEIKELLEKTAHDAHVPLIEGVFKAAVEDFVINAVVSDVIGSRFIIKKQTPYSLLQPGKRPAAMPPARLLPRPPARMPVRR